MSDGYAKEEVLPLSRSRGDRWIKSLEKEALRNDSVRWAISGREKPRVEKQRKQRLFGEHGGSAYCTILKNNHWPLST